MSWMLIVLTVWAVAAPLAAMVIGRAIRLADQRDGREIGVGLPDFVPAEWTLSDIGSR